MAGKVVNISLVLLSKFGAGRQESASKTATSHIQNVASKLKKSSMNRKIIVILSLFVSFCSFSQEGISFKDNFKPGKNYSTNSIESTITRIDVETDQETLDQLKNNGYELPMVIEEETNISANFATNEMQENGEFLGSVQYEKITIKNSINGKTNIEEKPYSGTKILGKYNKENEFMVDSIVGVKISEQNKQQLTSEIKIRRTSTSFPEYPLKLNDTFEYDISETTSVPGFKPIQTKIKIKFTLIEIKDGKAYFNIVQTTNLEFEQDDVKLISNENGEGKLIYDIKEEIITEFITENPIELSFIVNDKMSMKLKLISKTIFHKSAI